MNFGQNAAVRQYSVPPASGFVFFAGREASSAPAARTRRFVCVNPAQRASSIASSKPPSQCETFVTRPFDQRPTAVDVFPTSTTIKFTGRTL